MISFHMFWSLRMLGVFLKRLRDDREISQETMAENLGLKRQSSITAIESGAQTVSSTQLALWLDVTHASDDDRLRALDMAASDIALSPDLT